MPTPPIPRIKSATTLLPPFDPKVASAGVHLLVVEDDADILDTLREVLEREGFRVSTAANGREALALLRQAPASIDLVLLDLMMPVMDGWQFRVAQKREPALVEIPVLAITADSSPKAVAIDADAYLVKPFDYDTLLATVRRVLLASARRRHRRATEREAVRTLESLAELLLSGAAGPLAPEQRRHVEAIAGAVRALRDIGVEDPGRRGGG